MATKLQHTVNPLATNSLCQLDNWNLFRDKGKSPQFLSTMLEQQHIESIKKTMLMHEDIFKQQVRELHRLYGVQRMLMENLNDESKQSQLWATKILLDMNNSGLVRCDLSISNVNPSSQECEASCSAEVPRIPKRLDLQRPTEVDMPTRVESVNIDDQTGLNTSNMPLTEGIEDGSDEDSNGTHEVELTLSIGPSTVRRSSRRFMSQCSPPQVGSSSGSIKKHNGKKCGEPDHENMVSSSIVFNQESKKSHWLFQDLSLNRR